MSKVKLYESYESKLASKCQGVARCLTYNDDEREAIDEARALAAENAQMRNSMLRLVTTHCAAAIKGQAADAELEQYLSAGIAQIEAERDKLRAELEQSRDLIVEMSKHCNATKLVADWLERNA